MGFPKAEPPFRLLCQSGGAGGGDNDGLSGSERSGSETDAETSFCFID